MTWPLAQWRVALANAGALQTHDALKIKWGVSNVCAEFLYRLKQKH
jgi:hypothetical protein